MFACCLEKLKSFIKFGEANNEEILGNCAVISFALLLLMLLAMMNCDCCPSKEHDVHNCPNVVVPSKDTSNEAEATPAKAAKGKKEKAAPTPKKERAATPKKEAAKPEPEATPVKEKSRAATPSKTPKRAATPKKSREASPAKRKDETPTRRTTRRG